MRTESTFRLAIAAIAAAAASAFADDIPLVTHAKLQAVDANGKSTFVTPESGILLQGILLNTPEDLLSTDYVPGAEGRGAGAQYQVFVQALAPDRGGTALYMSEGTSAASYDEEEWASELARLAKDPDTGQPIKPGDLVEVFAKVATARTASGKCNINEGHSKSPEKDFHIRLIAPDAGLPPAKSLVLADLVALADDGTQTQIFDPARETGGERWQGSRVRLDAIRLADDRAVAVWNSDHPELLAWRERLITCADATGRTFPLRLPRKSLGSAPATNRYFSAIGILNQEGADTAGYELIVQEIGPVLDLSFEPVSEDGGSPSTAVLTYSADYADYALEVSDDSGTSWHAPALAFPVEIVVRDAEGASNRLYRLVLPDSAE